LETLIKTIQAEKGELYVIINSRRILLANCKPQIEIYEKSANIPILGEKRYRVKSIHSAIIICPDQETTREVDEKFLCTISRFELITDIQRTDGVFERVMFDSLMPKEIDLCGDWRFDITDSPTLIRKLLIF
jgi:hypothetical protein